MIVISNLSKSYGVIKALKKCNLTINPGEIFGLLGPNGAGKTTMVKAILDLVGIDEGQITIAGVCSKEARARIKVAYLPERFTFYPYYTVESSLKFFGEMNLTGVGSGRNDLLQKLLEQALEKLKLADERKQRINTLSKGQMQRLGLAQLLMRRQEDGPHLFILDEPLSGLDPIGIKDVKRLITELRSQGNTVLLNSHILSEIEQVCDRIAVLRKGEVLAQGVVAEILKSSSLEDFFCQEIEK